MAPPTAADSTAPEFVSMAASDLRERAQAAAHSNVMSTDLGTTVDLLHSQGISIPVIPVGVDHVQRIELAKAGPRWPTATHTEDWLDHSRLTSGRTRWDPTV